MTAKFTKRAASQIMKRGINAIRIAPASLKEAEKALTKEDVRRLISTGAIYAIKEKHNLTTGAMELKQAREEGRRRGIGRRRGTRKARSGRTWEKKVRSQRRLLKMLKQRKKIDTVMFNRFYSHVKGNVYTTKATLLARLREEGMQLSDQELEQMNEEVRKQYVRS